MATAPSRRIWRLFATSACVVLGLAQAQSTACPTGVTAWNVSSPADALELIDALNCAGPAQFEVDWSGKVSLTRTISISNGSSVTVTGLGAADEAVIDGDGAVRLFEVTEGSTLQLNTVSLVGGLSDEGGAIYSVSSNVIIGGDTTFTNNAASSGGAIYSSSCDLAIQGRTTFADSTGRSFGGAIYAKFGNLSIEGDTTFTNNTSNWGGAIFSNSNDPTIQGNTTFANNRGNEGGAIYFNSDGPTFQGNTTFADNAAAYGGAFYTFASDVTIQQGSTTTFVGNVANTNYGGAISSLSSELTFQGHITFADNKAEGYGGAIWANICNMTIQDHVTFTDNAAGTDGGAIMSDGGGEVIFEGDTSFTDNVAEAAGGALYVAGINLAVNGTTEWTGNTAGSNGGAIAVTGDSSATIAGQAIFLDNAAGVDGGAIYAYNSAIATDKGTTFTCNAATAGGGGGVYASVAFASLYGANFTANEARWGGGLALFSSGSVWNEDSPFDTGPANTTACIFEHNKADEGGAMYTAAGYDMVQHSLFQDNFAGTSGGAFLHSGVVVTLNDAKFVRNIAGGSGLAIMSLGIIEDIFNTTFESNTYFCPAGMYGYDVGEDDEKVSDTCRFDTVCSGCASCEEIPESVDMPNVSFVPICDTIPEGVKAHSYGGANLSTLDLESGYYRTSSGSHIVLACQRAEACKGGVDTSDYCASGYKGAYCAVCEDNFASGYLFSCSSCVGDNKRSAIGVSVFLFLASLVVIAFVVSDLIRVVDVGTNGATSGWERRLTSCRGRTAKAFPLTSIKIVVVAWQIVTQFSSVVNVVYPDVYERFLSVLNLVNFNLGIILSVSCVVDTNFYSRLIFATLAPLVVLGALAATHVISRSRNRHSPEGMQAAKHKHLSIALFIMLVVYSSVSFIIFQTFACETLDDGVRYLRADYDLTCSADVHTVMQVYAGLMILVYPIGIPAAFAWWLRCNRHDLVKVKVGAPGVFSGEVSTLDHLQPMRGLWAPYKPRRYYFEVVECGRRIALTGLAVFIYPGSAAQVALEVVLSAISIGVSDILSPFADSLDGWLYRAGAWVIFFTMYVALLLKVDASSDDSGSQEVFASVLIAAHVGMVFVVVIQGVLSVKAGLVSIRDQPISKNSIRFSSFAQLQDGGET